MIVELAILVVLVVMGISLYPSLYVQYIQEMGIKVVAPANSSPMSPPIAFQIQDHMRLVLNDCWDPIGVAADVSDEYDIYIAQLYGLLQRETDAAIVEHLRRIEVEWLEAD